MDDAKLVVRELGVWACTHKKKVIGLAIALGLMYWKGLSAQDAATTALQILGALAGL